MRAKKIALGAQNAPLSTFLTSIDPPVITGVAQGDMEKRALDGGEKTDASVFGQGLGDCPYRMGSRYF